MLEIERAGVKDHGIVTGLLTEFGRSQGIVPEVDHDRWEQVIAELLSSQGWLFELALDDGEPVGIAAVNFSLSLFGSGEDARLAALIIREGHRRCGFGTELMRSVMAAVRRRGCREFQIVVSPDDEALAAFYGRFGFADGRTQLSWRCGPPEGDQ